MMTHLNNFAKLFIEVTEICTHVFSLSFVDCRVNIVFFSVLTPYEFLYNLWINTHNERETRQVKNKFNTF